MLDTSNHAKEATWHTRIDPQQHGLINTPRFSKRYNLEVVAARLKDTLETCGSLFKTRMTCVPRSPLPLAHMCARAVASNPTVLCFGI